MAAAAAVRPGGHAFTRDAAHAREVMEALAADGYKPKRLGSGPMSD